MVWAVRKSMVWANWGSMGAWAFVPGAGGRFAISLSKSSAGRDRNLESNKVITPATERMKAVAANSCHRPRFRFSCSWLTGWIETTWKLLSGQEATHTRDSCPSSWVRMAEGLPFFSKSANSC